MQVREYGMARCVGEDNLAAAINAKASEGFSVHSVVFTGMVAVMPQSGIIDPNSPPEPVCSYLLMVEKVTDMGGAARG